MPEYISPDIVVSKLSQLLLEVILVGDGALEVSKLLADLHHPVPPVVGALGLVGLVRLWNELFKTNLFLAHQTSINHLCFFAKQI